MPRPTLPLETWGDISTQQLAPGKWQAVARYRDIDGVTRRVKRVAKTKNAARDALREAMRDRTTPVSGEDIHADTRVSAVIDLWWAEFKAAKAHPVGTIRRYRQVLDGHVRPAIGEWRLRECSVSKLDRLVKAKTEKAGYSTASILVVLLTAVFDLAVRHDAIDSNPMKSVASVPKPDREVTYFSLDDVAELRAILHDWDNGLDKSGRRRVSDLADPVDMFLATGFRPGEIFAIEWPDVDFTMSPIGLRTWSTMALNEQGKWDIQRRRKNNKTLRVRLPKFAEEMLLRRRIGAQTSMVFPSSTGTPRVPGNFRTQWHNALKGTRFEGRLPKEFRSTVATFLRNEVGIEAAQHQLNHASLTTTEQRYAAELVEAPDLSATLERLVRR